MKAVNVDDVLKILHKYGKYIFVTDYKKYSDMVDEIANLKALEQEPFINKPCISEKVCEHDKQMILEKLRAEIKHFMYDVNPSSSESDYACNYILQIIDKYKADRSEEDGNDNQNN